MRFIHCADLHIDSPLRGFAHRDDAPLELLTSATRQALDNLVDLAIDEAVDFVVIAGDVFDGDWPDYSTGLFFNSRMAQLGQAHIEVVMVSGNHDAESQISRRLELPANVRRLSSKAPETILFEHLGVAIHGQSFPERDVRENLVPHYPAPVSGLFNIGLLHCSVDGLGGHETYAPCKLQDLTDKGYDYWALGHIHQRQILHENPYVVYCGNLQGRHVRETGAKGVTLVTVQGSTVDVEFRPVDVLRWAVAIVDLADTHSAREVEARVNQAVSEVLDQYPHHPIALRIVLTGQTAMHGELWANVEHYQGNIENLARLQEPSRLWVEKIVFQTEPLGRPWAQLSHDALAMVFETTELLREDEAWLSEVAREFIGYQDHLGREYQERQDATLILSGADIKRLLLDAQALIVARGTGSGSDEN